MKATKSHKSVLETRKLKFILEAAVCGAAELYYIIHVARDMLLSLPSPHYVNGMDKIIDTPSLRHLLRNHPTKMSLHINGNGKFHRFF